MNEDQAERAGQMKYALSVVVPVYNEEQNVGILYGQIRSSLDPVGEPYEVIFIDDGSSDGTAKCLRDIHERAQKQGSQSGRVRIVRLARNFGQTVAMQAGFDCARGEKIVSLDGDLQNDPRDIPRMLSKLEEGYDVVCGWRKERQDKTVTRILPSLAANWLIGVITGVRIHDNGCSLRAYRASVIQSIRLYSDMHRFISPMCTMVGARICETVVNHRPRKHGKTKYGISRTWKVLFDIITVKMLIHFHYRPMRFFSVPLLLSFFFALGLGVVSTVLAARGYHTIVLSGASFLLFFLFGSVLSWGLLGEFYVNMRIRREAAGESHTEGFERE
jgi:glycosyltransferase involved in cell wall biosynthesis